MRVVKLACAGKRHLRDRYAREPEVEVIRDHEKTIGLKEQLGIVMCLGFKLKKSIDGRRRNTCLGVEVGSRNLSQNAGHALDVARVAVTAWFHERIAFFVDQHI